MERETAFLSSFSGYMRLRPGPGLRDRVRRAAQAAADTPREISASLILRVVREAPDGAEITQRELHALPAALSCAVFDSLSPLLEGCCRERDLQRKAEAWAGEIAAARMGDISMTAGDTAAAVPDAILEIIPACP